MRKLSITGILSLILIFPTWSFAVEPHARLLASMPIPSAIYSDAIHSDDPLDLHLDETKDTLVMAHRGWVDLLGADKKLNRLPYRDPLKTRFSENGFYSLTRTAKDLTSESVRISNLLEPQKECSFALGTAGPYLGPPLEHFLNDGSGAIYGFQNYAFGGIAVALYRSADQGECKQVNFVKIGDTKNVHSIKFSRDDSQLTVTGDAISSDNARSELLYWDLTSNKFFTSPTRFEVNNFSAIHSGIYYSTFSHSGVSGYKNLISNKEELFSDTVGSSFAQSLPFKVDPMGIQFSVSESAYGSSTVISAYASEDLPFEQMVNQRTALKIVSRPSIEDASQSDLIQVSYHSSRRSCVPADLDVDALTLPDGSSTATFVDPNSSTILVGFSLYGNCTDHFQIGGHTIPGLKAYDFHGQEKYHSENWFSPHIVDGGKSFLAYKGADQASLEDICLVDLATGMERYCLGMPKGLNSARFQVSKGVGKYVAITYEDLVNLDRVNKISVYKLIP